MNILFYSTCSTQFDGNTFHYENTPLNKDKLEAVTSLYPEHHFTIAAQFPGMFVLDMENNQVLQKARNVEYIFLPENSDVNCFVQKILQCNPDIAICITGFYRPFDWQGLKDSLIGSKLLENGIKVICNPLLTQNLCFDKTSTQDFFELTKFKTPQTLKIDNQLFWAERNHQEVLENPYKEYIFNELEKFTYPVIIKDPAGLSSAGMEVVNTFNQAKAYLNSKKNNSDKLVQKLIEGKHFGVEIFGKPGNYYISKPFQFSLNQYKITSPKQSVKAGPVNSQKFLIEKLTEQLLVLSELLDINGSAQVDLVFDSKEWYIIEINPRLSGMTNTVCESLNTTYFNFLIDIALNKKEKFVEKPVISLKLPVIDSKTRAKLIDFPFIKQINQTRNDAARQKREAGYCEIILKDENSLKLKEDLCTLKQEFTDLIDEGFYTQALKLLEDME